MDVSEFTADNMQPYVGTTFRLQGPNGESCELELVEVKKVLDRHVDPRFRRDTFSIFLAGPAEPIFPQGTYPLTHDTIGGPNPIFIVPSARRDGGVVYEAVFT
ncbi:MAG: hypothetical protein JWO56_2304 [Acidobacteria bacterium]|nr:hypothetical protein [Acidobacteriota bacterium]